MKKLQIISSIIALILMSAANAGHEPRHDHSSKSSNSVCKSSDSKKITIDQSCARTMTSVFDTHGKLWSTWTNGEYLYVNYSEDKGITYSAPVKVNSIAEKISARHEHRPKIKLADNGNIYISWTRKLKKRFTGDIRFSKSTNNGKSYSLPVTVNDNREIISHRFDALGVNNKGDIYISWLDKRDKQKAIARGEKYNGASTYFAVSLNEGQSFSKNIKIADNTCECCRMAIDFDKRNLPVIAWRNIYGENTRDHSIVSFKNSLTPRKPMRLSNDKWTLDGCPHHGPSISVSDNNAYHAVWFNDAKNKHGIFYANSNDEGKRFSQPIEVGQYKNQASHADIVTLNNSVYIVWQEHTDSRYQLYTMSSQDGGKSWGKPKRLSETTKTPDYPFILKDKNKIYVSWHIPSEKYHLLKIKD